MSTKCMTANRLRREWYGTALLVKLSDEQADLLEYGTQQEIHQLRRAIAEGIALARKDEEYIEAKARYIKHIRECELCQP